MDRTRYGIGLYAPAGFVIERGGARPRRARGSTALGHRVVVDPTCATRWQRFSATDDERLAAIDADGRAIPRVELAIAARGGYGWSRLLDRHRLRGDRRAPASAGSATAISPRSSSPRWRTPG